MSGAACVKAKIYTGGGSGSGSGGACRPLPQCSYWRMGRPRGRPCTHARPRPTRVGAADGKDVVRARLLQRQHVRGAPKHGPPAGAEARAVAGACQRAGASAGIVEALREAAQSWDSKQRQSQGICSHPMKKLARPPERSCARRAAAASKLMPRSMVRSWRSVGRRVKGSTHSSWERGGDWGKRRKQMGAKCCARWAGTSCHAPRPCQPAPAPHLRLARALDVLTREVTHALEILKRAGIGRGGGEGRVGEWDAFDAAAVGAAPGSSGPGSPDLAHAPYTPTATACAC